MASAMKVADRIVMIYDCRLIFDGNAEDIRNTSNETVKRFVLGEANEQELQTLDQAEKK